MGVSSMTGFAAREGAAAATAWRWELRSVNGKGLDVRLRLPDGRERLEQPARAAAQARLARGSVTLSLRLSRAEGAAAPRPELDAEALEAAVALLAGARAAAEAGGLETAPVAPEAILAMRGVVQTAAAEPDAAAQAAEDAAILADLDAALVDLVAAREAEGARIEAVIRGQVDRIEALRAEAETVADARAAAQGPMLARRLAAVSAAGLVEPQRIAQELALIAVKGDVREELDRLAAHVAAARELLDAGGAAGRRLDFLTQEFNREANTLCSKADFQALTAVGLELKTVVDQMREQVQNMA